VHYDPGRDCYVGEWLTVPSALFDRVLADCIRAGDAPTDATAALLDELSWSLDIAGVQPIMQACRPSGPRPNSGTPWPLRYRVGVVQPTAELATVLQVALQRAGFLAAIYVESTREDAIGLRAFLTPAPSACLIGLSGARARVWEKFHAHAPDAQVILTAPRLNARCIAAPAQLVPFDGSAIAASAVVHAVRTYFLHSTRTCGAGAGCDPQAQVLLRAHLLRSYRKELAIRALAYRGWSLSLVKRSRLACAGAARLRSEAQVQRTRNRALINARTNVAVA
jgi:hypothetical protein